MMNDIYKKQTPGGNNLRKDFTSSDRLATCSLIAGVTGLICSFFYIPWSLVYNTSLSVGLICGIIGIIMALMSRKADIKEKKSFSTRAIVGLVLSALAIALTFFFFSALAQYYEALRDPVNGPKINELMNRVQEQLNQQMNLQGGTGTGWIHF